MAFVEQEDILSTFEGLLLHLLKEVKGIHIDGVPRITYAESMERFGNDKPDIRFGMELANLNELTQNRGFMVFDQAETVLGIAVSGAASWSRKQIDKLTDWVKRPDIGMKGMVYCKVNEDGTYKSSVDKFYTQEQQAEWAKATEANPGDLILILAGEERLTRKATLICCQRNGLRNLRILPLMGS